MVFNIVIVSVLVILIIHYSIDYLKTFLNPSPPLLEDLKYKKYKTMIDEISKLRSNEALSLSDALSGDALSGDALSEDDTDLEKYFNSKIAE